MIIKKVSLEGDLDRFGGRALVIKTNSGNIKSPLRALTSSEIQYKAKLPFEPPLDNDLSEIVGQFYGEKWNKFINTNGSFSSRLRKMEFFSDKMAYTIKKFYPQLALGTNLNDADIKQLLELQRMSNLDFISIPNLPASAPDFENIAASFAAEVLADKKEPLIYLDMGLDHLVFQERFSSLLELSESGLIHSIGLIYRPIQNYIQNYRILWDNRESMIFLQMSQVPREFGSTNASTMHLLQKWGIDSFSVKVSNYVPPKKDAKPRSNNLKLVKRFDPNPLIFRKFHEWLNHTEMPNCYCPICKNKSAEDFLSTYGHSQSEEYPGQTFNAANKLHEYYRSSDEFSVSREYIYSGELLEYFANKDGLRGSDIPVPPKSTLAGWV